MILMIDNYDSFVYNLYQLVGGLYPDIRVIRNDAMAPEAMEMLQPEAVIISPGPGRPAAAGYSMDAIRYFAGKVPILGVCLGHQAICEAFGGKVSYAGQLMHGKTSEIEIMEGSRLFAHLPDRIKVARYHSLSAVRELMPDCLKITAVAGDGEIMAVEHKKYPVFGVQFHPESVMTKDGRMMIENFLKEIRQEVLV